MAKGFDTQLQDIAVKKAKAGDLQSAINQEAEERGLDAFHLSKGHIRKAKPVKGSKYGTDIFTSRCRFTKITDPLPEVESYI
jgi:hypothetical protein